MSDPRSPSALRAKLAQQRAATTPAPEPPLAMGTAPVVYRCGHQTTVEHFKSMECPSCRDKARQRRAAKKRGHQQHRHADDEAAGVGKAERDGRLPHGSRFDVHFQADPPLWTGALILKDETKFVGSGKAVEKLLRRLATEYRASITKSQEPTA